MEFLRQCYRAVTAWCLEVVQWRNAYSVPYVMLVNAIFGGIAFYAERDTQKKCLAAATAAIPLWGILFSTVQNQSIIVTILKWPFQDLWQTTACVLFGMSLYGVDNGQEEEAFWCSAAAAGCMLISPVYAYHQVDQKIYSGLQRLGEGLKYLIQLLIVRPLLRTYEVLKYMILFKWVPVLWGYLRSLSSAVYSRLDGMVFQHVRAFFSRVISVLRYWVCFYWLADLNNWLSTNVYAPLKQKLLALKNGVIYTVYGYWLRPLGRYLLNVGIRVSKAFLGVCNRCAIAIGNSVVWPIVVICYEQIRALSMTLYGILLAPVVNAVHRKYKIAEDMVFIYVLGPFFKRLIDIMPEKNPLAYESDKELEDFIPVEDDPAAEDSDGSLESLASGHLSNDDEHFLVKGLHQIDVGDSDSSNEEFFIYPKARRRKQAKEEPAQG